MSQYKNKNTYIFHEIEINSDENNNNSKPTLENVIDLIKKYKDIQKDSQYEEVRHLLPTILYTVLIEPLSQKQPNSFQIKRQRTVRIYFNDIPFQITMMKQFSHGPNVVVHNIRKDIFQESSSGDAQQSRLLSFEYKNDNENLQNSSTFLGKYFIPYKTKHCVSSHVLLNSTQQKPKKFYQSDKSIFKVDSRPMKFFLSPTIRDNITDDDLIAGFVEYCDDGNIKKNGDQLTPEKINDLKKKVTSMKNICMKIQQSHIQQLNNKNFLNSLRPPTNSHSVSSYNAGLMRFDNDNQSKNHQPKIQTQLDTLQKLASNLPESEEKRKLITCINTKNNQSL